MTKKADMLQALKEQYADASIRHELQLTELQHQTEVVRQLVLDPLHISETMVNWRIGFGDTKKQPTASHVSKSHAPKRDNTKLYCNYCRQAGVWDEPCEYCGAPLHG